MGVTANTVTAQSGMKQSLERLDRNSNGVIEPEEITPLARPFFEQLMGVRTRLGRLDLDRPNEISKLQEYARLYFLEKNGGGDRRSIEPKREGRNTVATFQPSRFEPLVPQFGLAEVKFPYAQDDLDFADRTMRSHDENKDGYIDRYEASRHEWTHRNPFDDDMDGDARLSRLEMAQRYARRRLLDRGSDELRKKAWRDRGLFSKEEEESRRREDPSSWWRRGGSEYWLTASLLGRFDKNKNSRLEANETEELGLPIGRIDLDGDGELTREELFAYMKQQQEASGSNVEAPPEWFAEQDSDGDQQIAMHEFTDEWSEEKVREFSTLDLNDDGFITPAEASVSESAGGEVFSSESAEVLAPRKTIVSEITVDDDFVIADLDVELSISHTSVSMLDAYLTGPDGQRIELFTAIGGGGDHFDKTVFDDQSERSITRGAAPYQGKYQTESILKKQPGLATFNDKSIRGTWQLIIRGSRSERYGLLHEWKLLATPAE